MLVSSTTISSDFLQITLYYYLSCNFKKKKTFIESKIRLANLNIQNCFRRYSGANFCQKQTNFHIFRAKFSVRLYSVFTVPPRITTNRVTRCHRNQTKRTIVRTTMPHFTLQVRSILLLFSFLSQNHENLSSANFR